MTRLARLATIGLAFLMLGTACGSATAGSGSLSPTPTSATSPSSGANRSLTATFRSRMMGYSVKYPAGWKVTPATAIWRRGVTNFWNDPEEDRLDGPSAGFHGTSQTLAPGQSPTVWIDEYIKSSMPCGTKELVPVGNQIGTIDLNDCPSDPSHGGYVGRIYDVAVGAGGRGYNFTMEGQVDHAFFLAMLATVTFTPQTATDTTPAASPS
jgi:hypothetical protein